MSHVCHCGKLAQASELGYAMWWEEKVPALCQLPPLYYATVGRWRRQNSGGGWNNPDGWCGQCVVVTDIHTCLGDGMTPCLPTLPSHRPCACCAYHNPLCPQPPNTQLCVPSPPTCPTLTTADPQAAAQVW